MNMKQILEMIDDGLIPSYAYNFGKGWKFDIASSPHVRGLAPDMTGLLIRIKYFRKSTEKAEKIKKEKEKQECVKNIRIWTITNVWVKNKHPILNEKCLVCEKGFEVGDEIVLAPIQMHVKDVGNVMAKPVHSKCYFVED